MMPLTTVSIDIEARLAKLEAGFGKATQIAQRNARNIERAFGGVRTAVSGVAGALAVALPASFLTQAVRNTLSAIDAFNDLKDATGASIENISGLDDLARGTGTTFQTVSDVLVRFNKNLKDARPNDEISRVFKALNLDIAELRRLDPAEALQRTARALGNYADDGGKARTIQELFGKSVREAAPFLNDLAEAGELNAKTTTQQAQQADLLNKQLARLEASATNAGRSIVSRFVPALNAILQTFNDKGLLAALDEFGNRAFDWERSQTRKQIKVLESDIADLLAQSATVDSELFSGLEVAGAARSGLTDADVKRAERIEALQLRLRDLRAKERDLQTGVGGGRGVINPPEVGAKRPSLGDAVDTAGIDKARRAYVELIRTVGERITLTQSELDNGEKLGEQQRFAVEIVTRLADAESRFTDVQKRAVTGQLERLLALDQAARQGARAGRAARAFAGDRAARAGHAGCRGTAPHRGQRCAGGLLAGDRLVGASAAQA
jgi:hypothetical protein